MDAQNGNQPPYLSEDQDALLREYIRIGGNPNTKRFIEGEEQARKRGLQHHRQQRAVAENGRDKWARHAGKIAERGLAAVAVAFALVIVLGGLSIGTVALLIAEFEAVRKGFIVIDGELATLYAGSIVMFYIVVLFVREVVSRRYEREPVTKFSLRILGVRMLYWLGLGKSWTPEYVHFEGTLLQVDRAVRWLMYTIVLFGLLGRLSDKLAALDMAWSDALYIIATQSTLSEILGYIGAPLATFALLIATHFIVNFIYINFENVTGGIDMRNFTAASSLGSPDEAMQIEVIRYYQTEVYRLMMKSDPLPLNGQTPNGLYQLTPLQDEETQPSETTTT